jgi:hypothetical protein
VTEHCDSSRQLSCRPRRALDPEEAALEIRDDRGELLTDRLPWATVSDWRPSSCGADLIDLEIDGGRFTPVPEYARSIWERWLAGPPDAVNAWAGLDTRCRGAWLDLARERACRRSHHARPAGHAYELDGRHITDEPALYLALGEAVNGPGGYFGGCLAALDDCLRGTFGYTAPTTLLWRDAATAREHLSHALTPEGQPYDLFASALEALEISVALVPDARLPGAVSVDLGGHVRGPSVDTELVALDVLHRDARIIAVIQRSHVYRAERDQSCALGLKCGEALFTYESGANPHVKMQPVLGGLPFGNALEVQSRAHT